MAEETLYCPSCHQRVRVPEEMLGQPVQCPLCRLVFTAPTRSSTAGPPIIMPAFPPGAPQGSAWPGQPTWQGPPSTSTTGAVKGPAIGLLITAIFGLVISFLGTAVLAYLVAGGQAATDRLVAAYPPGFQDFARQAYSPEQNVMNLIFQVVFVVLNAVILAAAIQMARGRSFWLAVVGSVLAIVNINNCCCVLGAPIGIWSLMVLFQPGVRAAFEQRGGVAAP